MAPDISQLLNRREDQWFERKSGRTRPRQVAEALVGFANGEGGQLVIGVHDGRADGLTIDAENAFRQAGRDFCEPPVRTEAALLEVDGGSRLLLLNVEASGEVHRLTDGDVYLRVGDESRRLTAAETRELEYDKGQSIYDARPVPGATMADLDDDAVRRYLAVVEATTPGQDVLAARGLLPVRDGAMAPSVAAILLFGMHPQQFFPEAWLRVVEYRGRSRLSGAHANVLRDTRFEGRLTDQIEAARAYLRERIPTVIRLAHHGRFEPEAVIPERVWLEAIVNAIIHRSYSNSGDHIRVELFDDRLEVESPGRLPGLVRPDNIRSTRFARNPRIARVMADLGYGREFGEGVDRMFEEMERAGLPDPRYEQRPASLRVSLVADPELSRLIAGLPPGQARVMDALRRAGPASTSELMGHVGLSRPTVLKRLGELETLGLAERVGGRHDPTAVWRVREPASARQRALPLEPPPA